MAEPFLSEIRIFSFNFPPKGWAFCNGQLMPINENQALFSLLGTTYGGNGQINFALPNLQGRTPIHDGAGYTLGQQGGSTAVTLNQSQMPAHNHIVQATSNPAPASNAGLTAGVAGTKYLSKGLAALQGGQTTPVSFFGPFANLTAMNAQTMGNYGGSQAHNNLMPFLALNFSIALQGIFPSQN